MQKTPWPSSQPSLKWKLRVWGNSRTYRSTCYESLMTQVWKLIIAVKVPVRIWEWERGQPPETWEPASLAYAMGKEISCFKQGRKVKTDTWSLSTDPHLCVMIPMLYLFHTEINVCAHTHDIKKIENNICSVPSD